VPADRGKLRREPRRHRAGQWLRPLQLNHSIRRWDWAYRLDGLAVDVLDTVAMTEQEDCLSGTRSSGAAARSATLRRLGCDGSRRTPPTRQGGTGTLADRPIDPVGLVTLGPGDARSTVVARFRRP
jgi:hypothetical protein